MTLRCIRCHRPMKNASESGLGPVCRRTANPIPACERDLFGYDIARAASAAVERVRVHIEALTVDAVIAVRHEAAAARRRCGVWAA